MQEITIRAAAVDDAAALAAIYAPYVETTAITFEYTAPDAAEFRRRIAATLTRYPYLVAEQDGDILGYAYLGAFGERAAYSWSAETSIYLRQNARGAGLGKRLYTALEQAAAAQHIRNLYAVVAYPDTDDAHLTGNSVAFHTHMGSETVGQLHHSGYKFDTWYNVSYMEKRLNDSPAPPEPFLPFPALGNI